MLNINYSGNGRNYDLCIADNNVYLNLTIESSKNERYSMIKEIEAISSNIVDTQRKPSKLQALIDSGELRRLNSPTAEKNLTIIFDNCKKEAEKFRVKRAEEAKQINLIKTRF